FAGGNQPCLGCGAIVEGHGPGDRAAELRGHARRKGRRAETQRTDARSDWPQRIMLSELHPKNKDDDLHCYERPFEPSTYRVGGIARHDWAHEWAGQLRTSRAASAAVLHRMRSFQV